MSNELNPCPFCGRTEAKLTECRAGWAFGWHVTCKHCLSVGATAYSDRVGVGAKTPEEKERQMKAYAVANWNRRTPSDHIVAANKKVDDNPPLTLEELRDMDGEPAYIVHPKRMEENEWVVCDKYDYEFDEFCATSGVGWFTDCYGDSWLAYRRKPEEEKQ